MQSLTFARQGLRLARPAAARQCQQQKWAGVVPLAPAQRPTGLGRPWRLTPRRSAVHVQAQSEAASSPFVGRDVLDPPTGPLFAVERTVNVLLVESVVLILDKLYADKPYARFYVLETIARIPYFAFTSILHLYETLGWWRRADYLKVHFAETWNELHHLLIMESLGGNEQWTDRFIAGHVAVVYYWMTCAIYVASPRMAYNLMEQVEVHAFQTYDNFLKSDGELLKTLPAPEVALRYYNAANAYLFEEFQTARRPGERKPTINNLYDVFCNIRDDEAEHCVTMRSCQSRVELQSPHNGGHLQETEEAESCVGIAECMAKYGGENWKALQETVERSKQAEQSIGR